MAKCEGKWLQCASQIKRDIGDDGPCYRCGLGAIPGTTAHGFRCSARSRLEVSDSSPNSKASPGGEYDIDFLASRLQAKHRLWSQGNLAQRIGLLREQGLLAEDECQELSASAEFLRMLEHFVRLVTGRPGKWLPAGDYSQSCVAKLMARLPGREQARALEDELPAVLRRTREIYRDHMF